MQLDHPAVQRFSRRLGAYLGSCRKQNRFAETGTVPPDVEELKYLLRYLTGYGLNPVITGSSALLRHLTIADEKLGSEFRPTADVDVFIKGTLPPLPPGWKVDREAVGVDSWISPSGGLVDFIPAGHSFPGGAAYPKSISVDPASAEAGLPVAGIVDLVRMKLDSDRPKDLSDLLLLAQGGGYPAEVGKLNRRQKENHEFVNTWLKAKGQ